MRRGPIDTCNRVLGKKYGLHNRSNHQQQHTSYIYPEDTELPPLWPRPCTTTYILFDNPPPSHITVTITRPYRVVRLKGVRAHTTSPCVSMS